MDDNIIIGLFWERKEEAIIETERKYKGLITKILSNYIDNKYDQEECMNDIYLKVWNSIPPNRPVYFNAYIARITKNYAINKIKENGRIKRGGQALIGTLDELAELADSIDIENQVVANELIRIIEDFLREQSQIDRMIFVRRYWVVESIADIADRYDMSKIYVNVRLHRVRNKLKKYLKERGVIDG